MLTDSLPLRLALSLLPVRALLLVLLLRLGSGADGVTTPWIGFDVDLVVASASGSMWSAVAVGTSVAAGCGGRAGVAASKDELRGCGCVLACVRLCL